MAFQTILGQNHLYMAGEPFLPISLNYLEGENSFFEIVKLISFHLILIHVRKSKIASILSVWLSKCLIRRSFSAITCVTLG